ncbi:MAG: hypothetical protein IJ158_12560 [Treponema sp.]|nr:hypothetical protein [Treponema sp.]
MATALNVDAGTYTINAKSDKTFTTSLGTTAVASGTWTLTDTTLSALISKELNAGGTALEDVTPYTLTFTVGSSNVLTLVSGENITPTPGPVTDDTMTYTWVLDEDLASLFVQSSALPDMTAGTYTIEILNNHFDAFFNNGTTAIESGYASVEDDSITLDTLDYYIEFTVGENNVLTFVKPTFIVEFAKEGASGDMRDEVTVTLGDKVRRPANPTKADYYTEEELTKMEGLPDYNIKYEFKNWYDDTGEDAKVYDFDTRVVDDTVIYAHWNEIFYRPVSYDEETIAASPSGLVKVGDTVTFTVTPPTGQNIREGYPKVEYYYYESETDFGDRELPLTQVENDTLKWTFTMPNSRVNISAEFDSTN